MEKKTLWTLLKAAWREWRSESRDIDLNDGIIREADQITNEVMYFNGIKGTNEEDYYPNVMTTEGLPRGRQKVFEVDVGDMPKEEAITHLDSMKSAQRTNEVVQATWNSLANDLNGVLDNAWAKNVGRPIGDGVLPPEPSSSSEEEK